MHSDERERSPRGWTDRTDQGRTGRRCFGLVLSALVAMTLAGCEPDAGEDTGMEERTDTLEMGADREEPIVPPMGRDTGTGMEGRDTVMGARGDTTSDTIRLRGDVGGEGDDTAGARPDTAERDVRELEEATEREDDGRRGRGEEDTLAAVRPQPSPDVSGDGYNVDPATLEELQSLIDQTLRDLERAQELLREAMHRGASTRGAEDTTGATRER